MHNNLIDRGLRTESDDFLDHLPATVGSVFTVQILMAVIFVYFAHDSAPFLYMCLWLGWWLSIAIGRVYIHRHLIFNSKVSRHIKRRLLLGLNFTFGLAQAVSVIFFVYFTFTERIIYTLIMLGSISGSVTIVGYRSMFMVFATPLVMALALIWLLLPIPESTFLTQSIIAVLILFYYWILRANSQSFDDLFQESNRIRSEQKRLNTRLNEALETAEQASESKTRFLASASHDLRQPIHTLSLLGAALQMRKLDKPTEKIADRLGQAIDILASQMDGLLDISKLDAGLIENNATVINLTSFIERISGEYSNLCDAKGLTLKCLNESDDAFTKVDPNLLERIVRNFLSNAIRYTETGSISVHIVSNDDRWRITVSDTGKGLSPEQQNHVFEEFYQVENTNRITEGGLGLGLAIAKRIAAFLETEILLESELGKGSKFSIDLPRSTKASIDYKLPQSPVWGSIRGLKVLCIDDETHVREALAIVLSEFGCKVTTVENTEQALVSARKQEPHAVIADFRLADGQDGIAAIDSLRQLYPGLPALLVSGDTAPERLLQAYNANIRLLHKPVDGRLLEFTLSELIND